MMPRSEVPKRIAEAIKLAWPDGVVEMIDLDEAPFWDTYWGTRWQLLQLFPHGLPASRRGLAARRGCVHRLVGYPERGRRPPP
jgi:hypothetical protein